MKLIIILFSFVSFSAFAQTVDVKNATAGSEDTTIQIKKGSSFQPDIQYEIIPGTEEVEGEAAPLLKDARSNWKKACDVWKKEIKELNKDNQIISISCGSMDCNTVSMESTCRSKGTNKIRVRTKN